MSNSTLNLSAAEIELIEINRQKEALALQEKNAKVLLEEEKQISHQETMKLKDEENDQKQIEAAQEFFRQFQNKLFGKYQVIVSERPTTYVASIYEKKDEVSGYESRVIKEIQGIRKCAAIGYVGTNISIGVSYENKKWQMFTSTSDIRKGKTNIVTVNIEIVAKLEEKIRKDKSIAESDSGFDQCVAEVVTENPEVNVEKKEEWIRVEYMTTKGYMSRSVVATYPNGLKVVYGFSNQDGNFQKRIASIDSSFLDKSKVIELLKALK